MKWLVYISWWYVCAGTTAYAQVLNADTEKELLLDNGVKVMVYASADNSKHYYYIPATLQLAASDNQPEISLLVYRRTETTTIEGGFMHLLVRWGLSPAQEKQAASLLLQATDSQAVLMGAAEIMFENDERIEIVRTNGVGDILQQSLTAPMKISTMPTHKTAGAFRFSAKDAAIIWNAVHKPQQLNGIKFRCRFYYTIAGFNGAVRTAEKAEGKIEATFRQWIDSMVDYKLYKMQKL